MAKKISKKSSAPKKSSRVKAVSEPDKYFDSSIQETDGLFLQKSQQQPYNYKYAYKYFNSYIFAAANINARACANATLRLYTRNKQNIQKYVKTKKINSKNTNYLNGKHIHQPSLNVKRKVSGYAEEFVEVTNHPILDLFYGVNNYTNCYELQLLKFYDLQITGNAYWHLVYNEQLGVPEYIYYVPSIYTYPIPSKDNKKLLDGYAYGVELQELNRFELDEIVQFKLPNPLNLYYGRSYLENVWKTAQLNMSNLAYREALSSNMGRPDYLIINKDSENTHQGIRRYEKELENTFRSNSSKKKFVTVPGNVDIIPLTMAPRDMMLNSDDYIIREVASVFGIPETMLKGVDGNYSNSREGSIIWLRNIQSLLTMDEEKLNEQILPLFNIDTEDTFLAYDDVVPEDIEISTKKIQLAIDSSVYSIAKIQEMQGEVVDEDLNNIYIISGQPYTKEQLLKGKQETSFNSSFSTQNNVDEDEKSINININSAPTQTKSEDGLNNNLTFQINNYDEFGKIKTKITQVEEEHTKTTLEEFFDLYDIQEDKSIDANTFDKKLMDTNPISKVYNVVNLYLGEQKRLITEYVSTNLKSIKDDIEDIVNGFETSFVESLKEPIRTLIKIGGTEELKRLKIGTDVFDVYNPSVTDAINKRNLKLAGQLSKTTIKEVKDIIKQGVEEGLSPQTIAKNISDSTTFSRERSLTIARTESGNAYLDGQVMAAEESGVVDHYEWMLSKGACEICKDYKKNNKKISASQVDGVLHPNCRCSVKSIIKD